MIRCYVEHKLVKDKTLDSSRKQQKRNRQCETRNMCNSGSIYVGKKMARDENKEFKSVDAMELFMECLCAMPVSLICIRSTGPYSRLPAAGVEQLFSCQQLCILVVMRITWSLNWPAFFWVVKPKGVQNEDMLCTPEHIINVE
jgi:hypothetical protein